MPRGCTGGTCIILQHTGGYQGLLGVEFMNPFVMSKEPYLQQESSAKDHQRPTQGRFHPGYDV